jgi:hypothetical protein
MYNRINRETSVTYDLSHFIADYHIDNSGKGLNSAAAPTQYRVYYISEFIPIEGATSIEAMAHTDNRYTDVMAFYTAQDQWTCIGTIPVQDTWKAVLQPRLITVPGEAGDLHEGETLAIPEGAKYIRVTSVTDTSQLGSGQAPYVTVHFN